MYLLCGHDAPLRSASIVAIIDLDGSVTTPDTADFLRLAERDGITRLSGDDLPKSAVITSPKIHRARRRQSRGIAAMRRDGVLFSTLAASVLYRRAARGGGLSGRRAGRA